MGERLRDCMYKREEVKKKEILKKENNTIEKTQGVIDSLDLISEIIITVLKWR